jgi:hypothetical protein
MQSFFPDGWIRAIFTASRVLAPFRLLGHRRYSLGISEVIFSNSSNFLRSVSAWHGPLERIQDFDVCVSFDAKQTMPCRACTRA